MSTTHITVLGAGYVGLTTATLLAHAGYTVYALEPNDARRKSIAEGKSFFYEEGLDPLIAEAVKSKKLIPTDSYKESIPGSQVIFSCVGTPDNPDGSSNLRYVFDAAAMTAKHVQSGSIYIQKSTVPVGTGEKVEKLFGDAGKEIRYVSNPEFLREGTALLDTLFFDRVVAGSDDSEALNEVMDLYRSIQKNRDNIVKLARVETRPHAGDYVTTSRNSAELIKVTANAFLALKISFANSIAKLADQVGADVVEVMDAVGSDTRIGRAFFNAGRGYGGGCFPKDVSGLIASGLEHGVELEIMNAAQTVNESMIGYIVEKVKEAFGEELKEKQIAVLGLAFKAGTSDVRRSPGVKLANLLSHEGAVVRAFDPEGMDEARDELRRPIQLCASVEDAVKNADAVLVATEWPALLELEPTTYAKLLEGDIFVDAINGFKPADISRAGLHYIGVGR
jgi:UDPglucose 6-dehydrogenase